MHFKFLFCLLALVCFPCGLFLVVAPLFETARKERRVVREGFPTAGRANWLSVVVWCHVAPVGLDRRLVAIAKCCCLAGFSMAVLQSYVGFMYDERARRVCCPVPCPIHSLFFSDSACGKDHQPACLHLGFMHLYGGEGFKRVRIYKCVCLCAGVY